MTTLNVQQAIDDFLRQKIQTTIEQKQKKEKEKFTEDDAQKIRDEYEAYNWITKVVSNIDKLFLNVSHVAKLTHSSNQAMSVRDVSQSQDYHHLVTTQTVKTQTLDSGYSDAKVAPIAEFLSFAVADSDKQLGECLAEDESYFSRISDDPVQRTAWSEQIKQAYQPKQIRSHVLAKQIYIPLGDDDYHLVSPMYSSSLAHEIYLAIKTAHDQENPIKKARKAKLWHEGEYIYYPKIAVLGVTKSNHQNVSSLNGQRGGLLYLYSALPPKWHTNPNPRKTIEKIIKQSYPRQAFAQIQYLLEVFKKNDLFINYDRKQALIDIIEDIVSQVCDDMLLIRESQPSSWTASANMPMYLRVFLDKEILQQQAFSQPEIKAYLDKLASDIAHQISIGIADHNRTKALENLWIKIMLPILQSLYQSLKAE